MKESKYNIEDQFVTHEIAFKLKEKGFNEPCIANYFITEKGIIPYNGHPGNEDKIFSTCTNDGRSNNWATAPMWQQAIDWLFIEHNIIVEFLIDKTILGHKIEEVLKNI
jgi:hypothetical protein